MPKIKTAQLEFERDWKPRRNGRIYCAPACGGRCTWRAYREAKRESAELVKRLGPGWKARVTENLGWHYSAVNEARQLDVSKSGGTYSAILGSQYIGHGRTPETAIRNAARQAKPYLATFRAMIKCIEESLK